MINNLGEKMKHLMRHLKKIYILTLIFAVSFLHSQDIRIVTKDVGISDIFLARTLDEVLQNSVLKKSNVNYEKEKERAVINPYILLSQRYNVDYEEKKIFVRYKTEENESYYFFRLNDFLLEALDYFFYHKDPHFYLEYSKIDIIQISNVEELQKINPALTNLKLYFFKNLLFHIQYDITLNLEEMQYFMKKTINEYGLENIKTTENDITLLYNKTNQINIKTDTKTIDLLKMVIKNPSIKNLYDAENMKVFKLYIDLKNIKIENKMKIYKSAIYKDILYNLKNEVDRRISEIKKLIDNQKLLNIKKEKQIQTEKFEHIDDL